MTIIIGTEISEDKVRVDGMFLEGSRVVTYNEPIIPQPQEKPGKDSILYLNPITKELFYEYVDRPLTERERILELEKSQGDLLMEIALLKMGGNV